MRIAIPIHSFEPGGVERVALRLAQHWEEQGEEVIVVLGRDRGPAKASAPDLDYRTLREPVPTDRWETLWMIWSLLQFLLVERVDAIFCPGNTYTIVCCAMKLLLGRKCPPVLVKVSNDVELTELPAVGRPFYRLWLRVQGAMLDRFVGLAEPMTPQIERAFHVPGRQVSCVPDPALSRAELDRAWSIPRRTKGKGCRYLTVGRLCRQKNHALMIEAFQRNSRLHDTLVIAGEGPERKRLERLIRRLGLRSRVHLCGHVDDVGALYAEADVFVLSSRYEGVPAVLLEALAAGLPIVATDCCASMHWLTGDGRFGKVVAANDCEFFGRAMSAARETAAPREEMRKFAATFTLESSGGLYLQEFASMLDMIEGIPPPFFAGVPNIPAEPHQAFSGTR